MLGRGGHGHGATVLQMMSHRHGDPLLSATYDVILDVGLRRTTVADVARRAGVSRMTFYRQFGDLDAAVAGLLMAELIATVERIRGAVAQRRTARGRLVDLVVLGVPALFDHPLLRRVLDLDPGALLPYLVDRQGSGQRAIVTAFVAEIRAGQEDGSIRPVDPHLAAGIVLLTAQSYAISGRLIGAEQRWDVVLGELRQLIDRYLAP